MKNRAILAAVAAAISAPAFGQTTTNNVILYGRLNVGVNESGSTGSYFNGTNIGGTTYHDFKSRTVVFDSASRLGVRGSEDLGNGLRAIFQIESGVNVNNGQSTGQAGQYNSSAGTLASRTSFAGLEGGWGSVKFGRQEIWYGNGTIVQTGANYINTDIPWLYGYGGRVSASVTRQSNVVSYQTPTWAGFNALFSWSPDANSGGAQTGSAQNTAGPGKNTNARLWGATLRWAGGPFQAQYDYVYKQNASDFASLSVAGFPPQNAQAKVYAQKAGLGWMYVPGGQISLVGTYITNTSVTGADMTGAQTLRQAAATISWEQLVGGNILLLAEVGKQWNVSGCDGTPVAGLGPGISNPTNYSQVCLHSGATAYMLGARYNLSKRTGAYLTWNSLRNGQNQFMDYNYNGQNVGATPSTGSTLPGTLATPGSSGIGVQGKGASVQIIAVGIMHNF